MKTIPLLIALVILFSCNSENNPDKQSGADSPAAAKQDTGQKAGSTGNNEDSVDMSLLTPLPPQDKAADGQYCYIRKLFTKGDTTYIDADYLQVFIGEGAQAMAQKRKDGEIGFDANGDTTWSALDDIYILNENTRIRTLPLARDFEYLSIYMRENVYLKKSTMEELKQYCCDERLFILTIQNGIVTRITQQYLP